MGALVVVPLLLAQAGACPREWRRPPNAPPQVAWCGRAMLAENLLVPEAEGLFASQPEAHAGWKRAVAAVESGRVAGTLGLLGLGVSLFFFTGRAIPSAGGPAADTIATVVNVTLLSVGVVGSFVAFVVHSALSREALEFLQDAMRALP